MPGRLVSEGGGVSPVVCEDVTVEVGFGAETETAEETADTEETAATLDSVTTELAGAGADVPAGAAETRLARRRAQKQEEMRIIL